MTAFTFAHVKFFGSGFLLNYFLIGLMFPAATAILPLFIRIRDFVAVDDRRIDLARKAGLDGLRVVGVRPRP